MPSNSRYPILYAAWDFQDGQQRSEGITAAGYNNTVLRDLNFCVPDCGARAATVFGPTNNFDKDRYFQTTLYAQNEDSKDYSLFGFSLNYYFNSMLWADYIRFLGTENVFKNAQVYTIGLGRSSPESLSMLMGNFGDDEERKDAFLIRLANDGFLANEEALDTLTYNIKGKSSANNFSVESNHRCGGGGKEQNICGEYRGIESAYELKDTFISIARSMTLRSVR